MMDFLDSEIGLWVCVIFVVAYIIADIIEIGIEEYDVHKSRKEKE